MKREHDKLYLNEDTSNVKDSFIAVANEIDSKFSGSIADIGCAVGAFPAYLKSRFPEAKITGIEYVNSLLDRAKENFSNIDFCYGDLLNRDSVNQKFDIITMLGVLCIFDNYEDAISNAISWLNPKGKIVMHNMISEYEIDVFIKYSKSSDSYNVNELESGWNVISEKSLSLVCEKNSAKLIETKPFKISVDIKPNQNDVMRSWTEFDRVGERQIYNALHIRQPQKIAIIEKI